MSASSNRFCQSGQNHFQSCTDPILLAFKDCGSTDNFINLDLVKNLKLEILNLKNSDVLFPLTIEVLEAPLGIPDWGS